MLNAPRLLLLRWGPAPGRARAREAASRCYQHLRFEPIARRRFLAQRAAQLAAALRPSSGVDTGNREKKNRARAHVGGCIALSSIRIAVTRPLTRAAGRDLAEGSVGSGGERATRLPLRSVASSRRPRTRHGRRG